MAKKPRQYAILARAGKGKRRFLVAYLTGTTRGGGPIYQQVKRDLTREEAAAELRRLETAGNPRRRVGKRRATTRTRRGRQVRRARRNPVHSERAAWAAVAADAERILMRKAEPTIHRFAEAIRSVARTMFEQVERGVHANPALALVGAANPPGRLIGTPLEVKYHRAGGQYPGYYKHTFKKKSRARLLAMPDGSLKIVS